MSSERQHFREYLQTRLAEYTATPRFAPNSIAVYQKYLQWLDASQSDEDFDAKVKADGHMFSVAKAEELDKRASLFLLQHNFQHEKASIGAELRVKAVESSTDYISFNKVITEHQETAAKMDALEHDCHNALAELMGTLITYITMDKKSQSDYASVVQGCWQKLKSLDEKISWQRIISHPPYRRRIIFDDARLQRLGAILQQLGCN